MSSAVHEPGQNGPRRTNSSVTRHSSSVHKVTPRRNVPEARVSTGSDAPINEDSDGQEVASQYDSDEVPVLIRLPDLNAQSPEAPAPKSSSRKRRRIDGPSGNKSSSKRSSSKRETKVDKKRFQQYTGNNKLIFGGVAGGVLVIAMLMLLNSGSAKPDPDQDGWAHEDLASQELEISIPSGNEPQDLYPGYAYEPPQAETAQAEASQFADGKFIPETINVSRNDEPLTAPRLQSLALPSQPQANSGWPGDELMGPAIATDSMPTMALPGANLNVNQNGSTHPAVGVTDQGDYRSTMNNGQTESYRIGKLNSNRTSAGQDSRTGSLLNRNITIPDTKSYR